MVCILISPSNWQWNGWDEQWLQCTMGMVCLLIQMKLSSHYAIIFWRMSHRYFPIQSARLHFRQNTFRKKKKIVYSSCTALQQCGGTQQLSTKQSSFVHFGICLCVWPTAAGTLVAIRAFWLLFWLSRWALFWSGSSLHLSRRQEEGTSACVQWFSGKLPSPAPESESCASFCSPEKGSSPCSSPESESFAAQPGGHKHCMLEHTEYNV